MLYISDLDGTLLDNEGNLTDFTKKAIRQFIEYGGKFTIASARSIFTAGNFIEQLGIEVPVILRNGAFIYDPKTRKAMDSKLMSGNELIDVMEFFSMRNVHPILHHIEDGEFRVDYTGIHNYGEEHYFESRKKEGDARLRLSGGYDSRACSQCISICLIDENDKLEKMHRELQEGPGREFIIHRYIDNYSNHTWLEVNHRQAEKGYASRKLLELTGEYEYTAFGDNINDIGMLDGASEAYIPDNSYLAEYRYPYKRIVSNDDDGVARFLNCIKL
jgi:HAD superfamily hydrolase (TIGR01484 family)